jgi:glycosyltransferase involved in cell wall biosynthesis
LIAALWRHSPQIVYYPVTATQVGWIGRDVWTIFLARLFGAKVIIHLRGGHLKLNYDRFNSLVKYLVKWSCSMVAIALVQAERLKNQFDGLVEKGKTNVLYNAIDLNEFQSAAKMEIASNPTVLFMGHMTQAKGYIDLMRALPIVVKHIPNVIFQVCGTLRKGERGVFFDQSTGDRLIYEDPYEIHMATMNGALCDNYDYRGIVTGDEKTGLLSAAHVFTLPSYSEGMSRSVIEAMACGKPVVVTPVGAHPEIIKDGENGLIVTPGRVDELADALIKLLSDTKTSKSIGDGNMQYIKQEFAVDVISAKLGKYFLGVLE